MKAGRVKSGDYAVTETVRQGKAKLVLLESGAAQATKERYAALCAAANVPLYECSTVGAAIGKAERIVAAVTEDGFKRMIEGAMASDTDATGV